MLRVSDGRTGCRIEVVSNPRGQMSLTFRHCSVLRIQKDPSAHTFWIFGLPLSRTVKLKTAISAGGIFKTTPSTETINSDGQDIGG